MDKRLIVWAIDNHSYFGTIGGRGTDAMKFRNAILAAWASTSLFVSTAGATTINFEGLSAPMFFTQADPPLTIDLATFTGGQLLDRTFLGQSVEYGTANFCDNCTNPINIAFSSPVSNLSLLVINNSSDNNGPITLSYTLADNNSHSVALNILSSATLSLPFTSILSATVSSAGDQFGQYSFFIDNVTYDAVATPLPAALPLFATGLGALGLLGWRRKRKSCTTIAAA